MPYTVNACFDYLNKNVVNLDPNQVPTARTSRDTLIESVHSLSAKGVLPISYSEKDIAYGSFARRTKIRPLDDIDLMICFNGCGGTWRYLYNSETIAIDMPVTAPILGDLRNEDGTLNSRKLIEKIKGELREVRFYKKAELHRNHEAVTLQLSSYSWNFDILPCFFATGDFYLIPDGFGNWKKTDPRIDQQKVTNANQQKSGQLLQVIRTMKYWKSLWWPNVSSYMFEQMVINGSAAIDFNQSFSQIVLLLLNYLSSAIYGYVADPKGIQGDLNQVDINTKTYYSSLANQCYKKANAARIQEVYFKDSKNAIDRWREIFGEEFPQYGNN